ncbi:MAG: 16S rRNA (uracil(1498)-N(3))-methyltransferase [Sedimentisphaerales bacterium]|nr:16S rRNA (uracil(1498)-N(3))-methyltransferase [Sedimentisphaerales bacterium]
MHRFFVLAAALRGKQFILEGSQARQISEVLRMKPGDNIIVLDNTGLEYTLRLVDVERQKVTGEIINKAKSGAEPETKITLFQSLLTRDKFEWVLQKCTEVGVCSFVPVVTQRSIVRRTVDITPEKLSRRQNIITEAAEQSGRGVIPTLENPVNFSDVFSALDDFDCVLLASTDSDAPRLREVIKPDKAPKKVALLIGPEGGFSDEEIAEACGRGAVAFSLGKRILRTETAAVVASALILHELND